MKDAEERKDYASVSILGNLWEGSGEVKQTLVLVSVQAPFESDCEPWKGEEVIFDKPQVLHSRDGIYSAVYKSFVCIYFPCTSYVEINIWKVQHLCLTCCCSVWCCLRVQLFTLPLNEFTCIDFLCSIFLPCNVHVHWIRGGCGVEGDEMGCEYD